MSSWRSTRRNPERLSVARPVKCLTLENSWAWASGRVVDVVMAVDLIRALIWVSFLVLEGLVCRPRLTPACVFVIFVSPRHAQIFCSSQGKWLGSGVWAERRLALVWRAASRFPDALPLAGHSFQIILQS